MTEKRTIVVVDDDMNQSKMFEEFLKDKGYTVHVAATGKEGLQKILDFRPDMVLLDLFLPDMKGSDVCTQLRASSVTQHIPVIICTAYNIDSIEKIKGFRAGADDYLVRPFELSELAARMEAIFRRSKILPSPDTLAGISALLKKAEAPIAAPLPPQPFRPANPPVPSPFISPISPSVHHAPPVKQEPPQIFKRTWEVLNHPFETFQRVDEHRDFVVGLCLVLGTPAIGSVAKLLQRAGGFDSWIGVFSLGVVVHMVMWFGTAGLLHMALPFQGVSMSMRRALTIAGLSWAPRFIEAVLGAVYGFAGTFALAGERVDFSSGIDMIPGLPANGLFSFLSHISLFDVWSAWLTLVALWSVSQTRERRWNSITAVVGLSCLLFGALSTF